MTAVGLVEGDTIAQTLWTNDVTYVSTYEVGSDVGEYDVVVSGYASSNYNLTINNGTLIVEKRALTITVTVDAHNYTNKEIVYGNAFDNPTITYSGLVGNEANDPSLAISGLTVVGYTKGDSVGAYTVKGANATSTNYAITYVGDTLTVKQRAIYITVDSATITYGDEDVAFTYSVAGYKAGEPIYADGEDINSLGSVSVGAFDSNNNAYVGDAGVYTIKVNGLSNGNYAISITEGKYTVNRKALTVTANDMTITFGDAVSTTYKGVVAEGFVKGDTLDNLGTQVGYNCSFKADRTGKAGTYAIVPKLETNNYEVTAVNGTLTVNKKAITITADSHTITFGDAKPTLTAKSNYYAYNDTIDTVGTFDISSAYARYNNVGSYTVTLANASSDKYTITLVNGKITVEQYSTEVIWVGNNTAYVYNGNDQGGNITASYYDVYGTKITNTITISFNNKETFKNADYNSEKNIFKHAGSYGVTATTSDGNYALTGSSLTTLVMGKAKYSADELPTTIEYTSSGVYSRYNRLKTNYAITTFGCDWVEDKEPTVDVKEYRAYYNADPDNYDNSYFNLTVDITPARVRLGDGAGKVETKNLIEVSIDTTSPTYTYEPDIYWVDGGEVIGSGYTITYSERTAENVFTPGSHYMVMTFSSVNYIMDTVDSTITTTTDYNNVTTLKYYVKYKSVMLGTDKSTLYTVEDAINIATSGNIVVLANTTLATQQEFIDEHYNTDAFYTIKSGVTLLVPFTGDIDAPGFANGYIGAGESGSTNYNAHPDAEHVDGIEKLYVALTIPSNVTLNVSGGIIVGAQTGTRKPGVRQNGIFGYYGQINLEGNVYVNSASLNVYGYVKGNGKITAKGTSVVTENMFISGFPGGTAAAAKAVGDNVTMSATKFMSSGDVDIDTKNMFPFNQYELRSIQSKLELEYQSTLKGMVKIATGPITKTVTIFDKEITTTLVKAKINYSEIVLISSSSDVGGGVMRIADGGKVTKTFANDRVKITTDGNVSDGYCTLRVPVMAANVCMSSQYVIFPIDGRTDIVVNSGTFTQGYSFKLLPGATLTIKSGATYNMNGTIVTYKDGFTDNYPYYYPTGRGDAKVTVEGTFNVNGKFGGDIYGINNAKVVISSAATITSIVSIEGTGTKTQSGTNVTFYFTAGQSQTRNLTLNNASGTTAASTGTTYTYNGSAWA